MPESISVYRETVTWTRVVVRSGGAPADEAAVGQSWLARPGSTDLVGAGARPWRLLGRRWGWTAPALLLLALAVPRVEAALTAPRKPGALRAGARARAVEPRALPAAADAGFDPLGEGRPRG